MFEYGVLGAGRQGTAAAYDMARWGDASSVSIADFDFGKAQAAADRVNRLLGRDAVRADRVDVRDRRALVEWLRPLDSVLSAVPYSFNLMVAEAAIDAGTSMADLGGNTDIVRRELALDAQARDAGISIVPDCGLMPGLGNILAMYAISRLEHPRWAHIYVGGLPQHPRPPFNYKLSFNIEGLTNEYTGNAVILRNGRVAEIPALSELETLDFPEPLGRCEAFITSGGTSTVPWTLEGRLDEYWEKTVRYPGHCEQIRLFADAGFLSLEPVDVDGAKIVPRKLFHRLVAPLITFDDDPDVVVLRVEAGSGVGESADIALEMLDFYDPETGFMSMERTTGFPAAMVVEMMARGEIEPGARPLEVSVPPDLYLPRLKIRGLAVEER